MPSFALWKIGKADGDLSGPERVLYLNLVGDATDGAKVLSPRGKVVDALQAKGFAFVEAAAGQAVFKDDGRLELFAAVALGTARAHGFRVHAVFRMPDPGSGLCFTDRQVREGLGDGSFELPRGAAYHEPTDPLARAVFHGHVAFGGVDTGEPAFAEVSPFLFAPAAGGR